MARGHVFLRQIGIWEEERAALNEKEKPPFGDAVGSVMMRAAEGTMSRHKKEHEIRLCFPCF